MWLNSALYHAESNGLVERAVQILKRMMKKSGEEKTAAKVAWAVFSYRITHQTTTGLSPDEMIYGRKLCCCLDFIYPDLTWKVHVQQQKQKLYYDKKVKERNFTVKDSAFIRNFSYGPKKIPGYIDTVTGPLPYKVILGDGKKKTCGLNSFKTGWTG